jgi:hypothetical protein
MNKFSVFAVILFIFGVVFLSGRDYAVHGLHYEYGLVFDYAWANFDWIMYFFEFQVLVFSCALIARSWKLFVFFEAFVQSSTQDIFFYGLWVQRFPAPQVQWTWMGYYPYTGEWTTLTQLFFSGFSLLLAYAIIQGVSYIGKNYAHLAHNPR